MTETPGAQAGGGGAVGGGVGGRGRAWRRGLPASAVAAWCLAVCLLGAAVMVSCQSGGGRGGKSAFAKLNEPDLTSGEEPTIRVRLEKDQSTLKFVADSLRVADAEDPDAPLAAGKVTVTVERNGGKWLVVFGSKERAEVEAERLVVQALPAGGAAATPARAGAAGAGKTGAAAVGPTIRVGERKVAGTIELVPSSSLGDTKAFDAVLELPIERYLTGVLVGELYPDWHHETYAAQAVAARSYALHERGRSRAAGRHYDIESTTVDQAFAGQTDRWQAERAVSLTRGLVLLSGRNGSILRAYYSSTCGGRPQSAAGIWPTSAGFEFNLAAPLQGEARNCPCEASRLYRWTRLRSTDVLSRRLAMWGRQAGRPVRELKRLDGIEPGELNDVDRQGTVVVKDAGGKSFEMSSDEFRMAANTNFPELIEIDKDKRLPSNDFTAEVEGSLVRFEGRGFGHGVGLCQFGAEGYAKKKVLYRDMLETFYPGSKLVRVW